MMHTRHFVLLFTLLLLFLLPACRPTDLIPHSPVPLNTSTPSPLLVTSSPRPADTATPAPSRTPTSTPLPTWTPLPKFESPVGAVETLMETNGGCRLPCWWGLTPGITTWDEARQFLEQFSSIGKASFNISTQPRAVPYSASFPSPYGDHSNVALITVFDNIIQTIRIETETAQLAFAFDQLLSDYGVPTSILVRQTKSYDENSLWYTVVLLYQDNRFLATFRFSAPISDTPINLCLDYGPDIDIWSPAEAFTPAWIQQAIEYDNQRPFMTIEEAAGFDASSFHQRFQNPNSAPCFQLQQLK